MSQTPDEYQPDTDESADTGTTYDHVTGEPDSTPHDRELLGTDAETGNPNAAASSGLAGDMGVSSERTGPADETGTDGLGDLDDIQGTGTVGSARERTHGSVPTQLHGPEMDDTQHEATQKWMDEQPEAGDAATPKRTVGEHNPAEVPAHPLGNKNPGHSGS